MKQRGINTCSRRSQYSVYFALLATPFFLLGAEEVPPHDLLENLDSEIEEMGTSLENDKTIGAVPLVNQDSTGSILPEDCETPDCTCPEYMETLFQGPTSAEMTLKNPEPKILINHLQGIVLLGKDDDLLDDRSTAEVKGCLSAGTLRLPGCCAELEEMLGCFFDCPLTTQTIDEIKKQIYLFYLQHNDPFVLVLVPKQKITNSVLQLNILKARLGKVCAEGNCHFPTSMLTRYVKLEPGEELDVATLQGNLNFINRNPFRQVNMIYAPGTETGTTDIILAVQDRRICRVYAGADNTGIATTTRQRLFGGFSCGRIFGLDNVFAYQYTSSYNFRDFQSHTGQYIMFLPWEHVMNVYGGYCTVHADLPFPTMRNHGASSQASGRYTIPSCVARNSNIETSLGFDFKRTNNTIEFSELFINFSRFVNLSQFVFELKGGKEWQQVRLECNGAVFWSPGALLSDESNANYEALRPGAKNHWVYGKASMRYTQRLPREFALLLWARGQYSSQNLLPSEQLAIGGYDTVRGYNQNQLTMDNGLITNVEFRTPPIQMISCIRRFPMKDAMQFLVFFDYGIGNNHTRLPGEPNPAYIMSTGPGIRYTLDPYVTARLDWGIKIHRKAIYTGGGSMVDFSVTISY